MDDKSEQVKTPSKSNAESNNKDTEDGKNRGWPKGKKRYPKIPGAPKQPLSGYVHFLNDRRENLRKECPEISFADISKKLAQEWSQLGPEQKQKYMEIAEHDKERYNKEFADYQLTDDYQKYWESSKSKKAKKEPAKKKTKKSDKNESKVKEEPNLNAKEEIASSGGGMDFPIFTDEFLEYNKARENELRQLRKQVAEMEEQNAVLQKHVENMQSAIGKLELETKQQQDNSLTLSQHLDSLKLLVVKEFQGINLPGNDVPISMDNVDEFMNKMHRLIVNEETNSPTETAMATKVKDIISKMDYSSLVTN